MGKLTDTLSFGFHTAVDAVLEYDTPKIVHIKSKKVGILNRLIQLAILGYIIGYAIVYEKGYQEFDEIVSAVSTKMKGVGYTNVTGYPTVEDRVWDVADYVVPPQENGAFFVLTNAVITANQSQGVCEEDPSILAGRCITDENCTAGSPVINGDGIMTGRCINSTRNASVSVCEIKAWCPTEINDNFPIPGAPLLPEAENWTVLIKNQIEFQKFGVKRRNILDTQNQSYLQGCLYKKYDPVNSLCPIFQLGTIVSVAGENFTEMATNGGFIAIHIDWSCNLDKSIDECMPVYSFYRIDNRNSQISKGWNFRYANYYYTDGVQHRDLIKAYGIRFILTVTGKAGKFSFVPLILNLGSGVALLALSTVICDIIAMYILKKGPYYRDNKYLYVVDDDSVVQPYLLSKMAKQDTTQYQSFNELPGKQISSDTTAVRRVGAYQELEEDQTS